MIGKEILGLFIAEYSQTLATVVLGRAAGVEGMFKSFGSRIRTAIDGSTRPLLRHLERTVGVSSAVLVREETSIFSADYPADTTLVADLQGLIHVADDALAVRGNKANVLSLGNSIRIHRLERASLVVVASNDIKSIVREIEQAAWALERCTSLSFPLPNPF